jgi:hypothetical protein
MAHGTADVNPHEAHTLRYKGYGVRRCHGHPTGSAILLPTQRRSASPLSQEVIRE